MHSNRWRYKRWLRTWQISNYIPFCQNSNTSASESSDWKCLYQLTTLVLLKQREGNSYAELYFDAMALYFTDEISPYLAACPSTSFPSPLSILIWFKSHRFTWLATLLQPAPTCSNQLQPAPTSSNLLKTAKKWTKNKKKWQKKKK